MAPLDWVVVVFYVVIAICIGIYFTKKASRSTTDFFVAGRTLPWFIAGTSIVATTFSCDTPLNVAGMTHRTGIFQNWFWWSWAIGQAATIFFFARLWRRTEALTDIEFVAKRYDASKATSTLRIFRVFYDGVIINCLVIASVTLAMAKIMKVMLNLSDTPFFHVPFFGGVTPTAILLLVLAASVLLYSALSGLYGVAYLDFVQFVLAMVGSIGLAVIVYVDASTAGGTSMMEKLAAAPNFKEEVIRFFPDFKTFDLVTITFLVYLFMVWWPGCPGHGYFVQRLLATRSEKDSMLAFLWYNICHYIIRPWPWIIVGVLAYHYFPDLKDSESSFPLMIDKFMPVGLKGIMVASLLAAFMSTIDTHLNWGSSYLLNDLYQPFINKNASKKHYIRVSRIGMIVLIIVALLITTKLRRIFDAYRYLAVLEASLGTVMILRWYWWRVNPLSEIWGIATCFTVSNLMYFILPNVVAADGTVTTDYFAYRLIVTVVVVAAVWVTVTLVTSRKPSKQTIEFYKKMRISGPGWRKVRQLTGIEPFAGEFRQNLIGWVSCSFFLLSILLSIGKFLFLQWTWGIFYLVLAVVSGYILKKVMSKVQFL
ncbi:MAG: sodium:solute symporter family protein [Planctomycetota bacterium]|jgi:SSS family solute:Na+ symporter